MIWHANRMRNALSNCTLLCIFKVNAILLFLLKGMFHHWQSVWGWTYDLSMENSEHPYGNHINLGLHQHYSCDRLSPIPEHLASERPGSPWVGGWPWTSISVSPGVFTGSAPPLGPFILPLALPFPLPVPLCHLPFFIWSLKLWNGGLHPPFFQSPLKFIGFSGGLPVLLPCGNRDQSIHYFDRDGCGSLCTVPITRTSKGGSPLFSAWPPIQDFPLSPHYAAPL